MNNIFNHVVFVNKCVKYPDEHLFFKRAKLVDIADCEKYRNIFVKGNDNRSTELPKVYMIGENITIFMAGDNVPNTENPKHWYSLKQLINCFGEDTLFIIHASELCRDGITYDNLISFEHTDRNIKKMTMNENVEEAIRIYYKVKKK